MNWTMYMCTYQQIQDMLSLQSDSTLVTDQEEWDHTVLYYKQEMCVQTVSVYMYNYVILYHYMYMYLIVPYTRHTAGNIFHAAILLHVFYTWLVLELLHYY